jgi:hypothetical protein
MRLEQTDQSQRIKKHSDAKMDGSLQNKKYIKLAGSNRGNFIQKHTSNVMASHNNLLNNYY